MRAPALRRGLGGLAASLLLGALPAPAAPAPGALAPDFALPGLGADVVSLSRLHGKPVYLVFWASWCPASQQAFPWLNALQARFGPRGLQVLAVGVDTRREQADQFLAQYPAHFTVAFDSANQVPRAYELRAMPTDVLIGADGRVRLVHEHFAPHDQAALEAAIVEALGAR